MRLFTAIQLPDDVRKKFFDVGQALSNEITSQNWPRVNWTREENLHVTLKFLGEVEDGLVDKVCRAIGSAARPSSIPLVCNRVEFFPNNGPIRIIAAGVESDGALASLFNTIEQACHEIGFPLDARTFRGHVTLGRCKTPLPTIARKTLARPIENQAFIATEFMLMNSDLGGTGPTYQGVSRFSLKTQIPE